MRHLRSSVSPLRKLFLAAVAIMSFFGAPTAFASFNLQHYGASSAPATPTTVRAVATRGRLAISYSSGASYDTVQTRTFHIARANIIDAGIVIPNFYVQSYGASNLGENILPGTTSVTASIEYPAGTFHQLTFGGVASASCSGCGTFTSDIVPMTIPRGAPFWVRIHWSNPNGSINTYWNNYQIVSDPNLDGATFGTSAAVADQTMGGSVANTFGGNITLYPLAIIGHSSSPAICGHGDSRMQGPYGDNPYTGDKGDFELSVGASLPYINLAMQGETAGEAVAAYTNRLSLEQYCTADVVEIGINDLGEAGATAATTESNITKLIDLIEPAAVGHPMIEETLLPETTSSDSWATVVNQTPASWDSSRQTVNAWIRSMSAPYVTGLWDTAQAVESGWNSGKWNPGAVCGSCNNDGIHESILGAEEEVAQEPISLLTGNN